ncbi:MAG: S8 family serine peptidase [Ahniella sp.]|nr:S8 family serine peptidase [Ahniella sp.]
MVVDGVWGLDPAFCPPNGYGGLVPIPVGQLPPGEYTYFIRIRDRLSPFPPPFDLSERFGSVSFVVTGNPRSIPTLGGTAMTLLGAMFLAVGLFVIRRPKWPAWGLLALLLPAGTVLADVFPLQVVLREAPAGPSPWAIVEGYDFASGSPPPISAMSVGQPVGAEYLLPVRAGGVFLSRLNTHHQSDRARLERTILLKYTSDANRQSALSALSASGGIESVFVPLEQDRYFPVAETSAPQPRSVTGSTPWRSLLDFPGAWEGEQGWARVGVLDNGYDPSHPALVAIDPAGRLTGGNVISAGTLDIGDLGTNQGVDFCDFFTLCDRNLDEAQPKAVSMGADCDVTAFDPVEDGVIRFEFIGHGTMTAGMIGAKPISGSVGPGACPNCGIWPIRTSTLLCIPLIDGGHQASLTPNPNAVIAGLAYLVNGGAQVVSSSNPNRTPYTGFCAANPNSPYCAVLRLARLHGVVFVAAAGNHRTDIAFPASHASVLSAGGANELLEIWNEDTDPPPNNSDQGAGKVG